ncbi:MAG: hypothetical protein HYZ42_01345 [Bacteroidetes bacterium]|nr:hypothetical protein [Bacteroidota bacterium]
MNEARLAGYSNNVYVKAASLIEKTLKQQSIQDQLLSMNLLLEMNKEVAIDTFLSKMNIDQFTTHEKLLYLKLLQQSGRRIDIQEVLSMGIQTPNQCLYWGHAVFQYRNDEANSTLLAYDILRKDSLGKQFMPLVKNYFSSAAFNRHTLARASLIQLYLADWMARKESNQPIFGTIRLNGYQLQATDFPYQKKYKTGDTIFVDYKGKDSYVNIITEKLETQPRIDETYFKIKTTMNKQAEQITLKPGEGVTLEVKVEVFKTSENVMIEIPIPAGFSYTDKSKNDVYLESNREFLPDKTAIFCTTLPRGVYTFTVKLMPKFSGTFNLPPAKIELMYYPEIRNNEAPKIIEVR